MSDAVAKDLADRKVEIEGAIELLLKTNIKITDWDVPEADDTKAANIILDIMQNKIEQLRDAVKNGKYENY